MATAAHVLVVPKPAVAAAAGRRRLLGPGWPLTALLAWYPLWWVLGLGSFAFIVFALPMAAYLVRRRSVAVPRGFGLWLLFLVWVAVSALMFPFSPPGTTPGSTDGRVIGMAVNAASYLAATVVMLYVINLPREDMPEQRLLRLLSVLFVVTVAGGVLGVVAPHFEFVSPLEHLLPARLRDNLYTQALVHPQAAQLQDLLGSTRARPSAPFGYTNFWGNNFSILLVWWVVFMWSGASRMRRRIGVAVCAIAVVPVVYSLDRALWVGLGVSVLGLILWMVRRSHRRLAGVSVVAIAALAGAFALTPLGDLVAKRATHGGSRSVRTFLTREAIDGAEHSPIIGYGGNRKTRGSNRSIALGPTPACAQCGSFGVGSNGQFWLVLFAQGFVGAALYASFFAVIWWFYRGPGLVASAGVLIVALSLLYMFFYNALPVALVLTMLSIGLLVRNALESTPPAAERARSAQAYGASSTT